MRSGLLSRNREERIRTPSWPACKRVAVPPVLTCTSHAPATHQPRTQRTSRRGQHLAHGEWQHMYLANGRLLCSQPRLRLAELQLLLARPRFPTASRSELDVSSADSLSPAAKRIICTHLVPDVGLLLCLHRPAAGVVVTATASLAGASTYLLRQWHDRPAVFPFSSAPPSTVHRESGATVSITRPLPPPPPAEWEFSSILHTVPACRKRGVGPEEPEQETSYPQIRTVDRTLKYFH